jgi:hypothetical protein
MFTSKLAPWGQFPLRLSASCFLELLSPVSSSYRWDW